MSTFLTQANALLNSQFLPPWLNAGVIVLLLLCLILRELLRVHGGQRVKPWIQRLNVVTLPAFIAFAFIVIRQILSLLNLAG